MSKICFILVFTMLSVLAISSIASADQFYSDVYKRGYYPFTIDLDSIFKILFCLLLAAIMSFISIVSIRSFRHCKRI